MFLPVHLPLCLMLRGLGSPVLPECCHSGTLSFCEEIGDVFTGVFVLVVKVVFFNGITVCLDNRVVLVTKSGVGIYR